MPRWEDRDRMAPEEFAAHLADTAPRWELLRRFQEEWGYEVPEDAVPWERWSESEHRQYLSRLKGEAAAEGEDDPFGSVDLSLPIPAALDEWWELPFNSFTHSPRLYWTHPEYPPTLRPDPGGYGVAGGLPDDTPLVPAGADRRVCVFKAEYEYCNEWGYAAADAGLADPRVLVTDAEEWVLQAGSLSEFFLQLAVQRLPSHYGWTVYGDDDTERIVAWVREELPTLGFQPWRELGQHITVYGAPDALVFHDTGEGDVELTVHGRSAEALRTLGARMGLDWSERILPPRAVTEAPKPIALRAGDTDENGRWTVLSASPDPMDSGAERSSASDGAGSWTVAGTIAVAGDEDGTLRARRLDSDAAPVVARPPAGPATALACIELPDEGPLIASGHGNGALYLWTPDSGDGPLEVARQRPKLSGLALTATTEGETVLAACWRDDVVALWDIASGERADLDLGPGITDVRLDADLRLTVGGPSGHAVVRLDADALWPARDLMLRVVSFESAACATDADPELVPRRLARLLSWNADEARRAIDELDVLLAPGRPLCSAAVLAFAYLTQIGAAVGVGAHHCHVRRRVLGLALRIAGAMDAAEEHWHTVGRDMLRGIAPILPDMLEEEDPATRTAGALIVAALPERDERADVLLRALAAGDPDAEVSAAAALALGDATAVETLVSAGWALADVESLPRGR